MKKHILKSIGVFAILFAFTQVAFAQSPQKYGQVSGSFQLDAQIYQPDSKLGITNEDINGKDARMNAFGNIIYRLGNFSAGVRYEAYLPPLAGFDDRLEGQGFANRWARYNTGIIDVTVGNFYEQFGSGMIFRAYEEWSLGYDNSVDGARIILTPTKGVTIKGIYGTQRFFWEKYEKDSRGIVRGGDVDLFINDLFSSLETSKTKLTLGGGLISKYQADLDPIYKLPENVMSWSTRFNLSHGGFFWQTEYAHKINDPNAINNFIYKDGQGLFTSMSYSQKGFGFALSGKWIDNMGFKSDRSVTGDALFINFLPPNAKTHTYSLSAMYPYATQVNGEAAIQATLNYKVPKKSKLGGKYGMGIEINFSHIRSIEKSQLDSETPIGESGTLGYETKFLSIGDEVYFQDLGFEINKKINKHFKLIASADMITYNMDVIEGHPGEPNVEAFVWVTDLSYRFKRKHSIRWELSQLLTKQDQGNWIASTLEYNFAPTWFLAVSDQYNYVNNDGIISYTNDQGEYHENKYDKLHYPTIAAGYTKGTTRVLLSYGRQREGILCVGGVCRAVPKSNGFKITITSSF
ncbi:hypothetical protein HNS38_03810 [Lentimicrobium sp. L6]|uniref:DUF6029 family protein n=1 Tax=Lentimicrobium sp. L6 TaxID=2735916 RepID=UPI0015574A42|nr:DUF6029 family protein [Lentimicrobium sp. L6]NPD83868.1 hypothetical protein [Lentimicrobium sp. L6]